MTNADKFESVFGIYATELWAKSEKEFLEWLNADACENTSEITRKSNASDDIIRREGAIKAIYKSIEDFTGFLAMEMYTEEDAINAIKSVPSAERTGHWKYKMTDLYIQRTCSTCGWSERMYHRNRNQDGLVRNFCPNCGCKMREEIDE